MASSTSPLTQSATSRYSQLPATPSSSAQGVSASPKQVLSPGDALALVKKTGSYTDSSSIRPGAPFSAQSSVSALPTLSRIATPSAPYMSPVVASLLDEPDETSVVIDGSVPGSSVVKSPTGEVQSYLPMPVDLSRGSSRSPTNSPPSSPILPPSSPQRTTLLPPSPGRANYHSPRSPLISPLHRPASPLPLPTPASPLPLPTPASPRPIKSPAFGSPEAVVAPASPRAGTLQSPFGTVLSPRPASLSPFNAGPSPATLPVQQLSYGRSIPPLPRSVTQEPASPKLLESPFVIPTPASPYLVPSSPRSSPSPIPFLPSPYTPQSSATGRSSASSFPKTLTPSGTPVASVSALPSASTPTTPRNSPLSVSGVPVASSPSSPHDATPDTSPLPQASARFESVARAIHENQHDDLLISSGYVSLETVTIAGDHRDKALYVKAYNSVGDICFINADRPGVLTVQLENRTLVKIAEGSSVPKSVKISAANCAGNASCGVAFQCEGEFCMINREDTGKFRELTYITTESASEKRITPVNSPVAFPIITLSEIQQDNQGCISRVRKATDLIQANALAISSKENMELLESTRLLADRMAALHHAYNALHAYRKREVEGFMQHIDAFRKLPQPLSEANQVLYKSNVDRLFKLNTTCTKLLGFMDKYNKMKSTVQEAITLTNDSYFGLYLEVKENYTPDISRDLMKSQEFWGLPAQMDNLSLADLIAGKWGDMPDTMATRSLARLVRK